MKILILVMSCGLEKYPELVQKQRDTWDSISNPNTQTVYYYSGYATELIGDRLIVDVHEGPGYFYIKTMEAFKKLLEYPWDYIFKTDNSSYVYKPELVRILESKPRKNFYGGHLYGNPKYHHLLRDPFLWGEGFALSRDVVEFLVEEYQSHPISRTGVEDVHIGMILDKKFEWDISMIIHEFYKEDFRVNHVYRCKHEDHSIQLASMDAIHYNLYNS